MKITADLPHAMEMTALEIDQKAGRITFDPRAQTSAARIKVMYLRAVGVSGAESSAVVYFNAVLGRFHVSNMDERVLPEMPFDAAPAELEQRRKESKENHAERRRKAAERKASQGNA